MRLNIAILTFFLLSFGLAQGAQAQNATPTPPPVENDDNIEKIFTEEVRINFSAFDRSGKFAAGLQKEDLVISEDGRLHLADSLTNVPANVLILIDSGGEDRRVKGQTATRRVANSLIGALDPQDSIAIIEFDDQIKILAEWTRDRDMLGKILKEKMGFGKTSRLSDGLVAAVKFMERAPQENRHIVLITDGVDNVSSPEQRAEAMKSVLGSSVNVHVLSYTLIERRDIPIKGAINKNDPQQPGKGGVIPPDIMNTLPGPVQDTARNPRIISINLDREMARKYKKRAEDLKKSEIELAQLSADTNGEFFLPVTLDEMEDKTGLLAKNIDSQYTLTYTPKRALSEATADETRNIEVTVRRAGFVVQGKRKLAVPKAK